MLTQDLSFSKSLNPFLLNPKGKFLHSRTKPLNPVSFPKSPLCKLNESLFLQNPKPHKFDHSYPNLKPLNAGRSKKTPKTGRIEGSGELRREAKRNARRKSKKLAESLFYRLKNPHKTHADNFSEDELQMIGLGYDRMVRFMSKDDPNLKHPYDWYKYGEFGPYSWRGIVVGDPIRGRMSDECATIIGEVRDHEEWEKIEQHEMAVDFGNRLRSFMISHGAVDFGVEVCLKQGSKIVKASPKAYVDDVVKAYEKLSDEKKSKCLEFLLMNHPVQLLHPYTKEWKAKLEEMEIGNVDDGGEDEDDYDIDDELMRILKQEFQKALRSNDGMESFVKRSVERTSKVYEEQLREMETSESTASNNDEGEGEGEKGRGRGEGEIEERVMGMRLNCEVKERK
ncbi:2-isopropylmalate synthase [Bienertia sinuspersici]